MSLGWRRGLLDHYCFALLNNALVRHRALQGSPGLACHRFASDRL